MNELDSQTALKYLLELLPPNQAAIAKEMYGKGRPLNDIARELGITFNEARGRASLARKSMRNHPQLFQIARSSLARVPRRR